MNIRGQGFYYKKSLLGRPIITIAISPHCITDNENKQLGKGGGDPRAKLRCSTLALAGACTHAAPVYIHAAPWCVLARTSARLRFWLENFVDLGYAYSSARVGERG